MKREEYAAKRNELLDKAQSLLNENKIDEANAKMAEIDTLDEQFSNEAKAAANLNALNGVKTGLVNVFEGGVQLDNDNLKVLESIGIVKGGNNVSNSLFLNKADKLADRVNIKDENSKELLNQDGALGEVIKGMVTGKWSNLDLKNVVTTTSTGILIPEILSANIIDLARNLSLFAAAGVPVVPMDTNNMTISRVTTDPTFSFKAEGAEATENSFELDGVELKAKTAYGYAYVSLESINSSKNLDQIIRQVFAQAMANTIDKAFMYGQYNSVSSSYDTFAPKGIINDTGINSVVATTDSGYDAIIKAISKIRQANGKPTAYGINAETEELFSLLKTTDGQYLSAPKAVTDLQQIVSNQLKYDATNGSDALVFDPMAMLIGMQNNIQIKIIEDGECLRKGLVGFQIYSMLDCQATQPKHICKVTGIK